MSAFKLISLRSIIAFATLFTWAGSLYLNNGLAVSSAVSLALLWGIVAMAIAALIPYSMRKLTETGNIKLASCVGTPGSVYMDIPEGGQGEIRVTCSGVLTHVKARARGGMPIKAGTQIRVVRMLQPSVAEVEKITE
jgi:membrane protein implicated in regulation of membrane protease activity